jgi:hypothetical protein
MAREYLSLPIEADEGFPQSFRFVFGNSTYRISLYVTVLEDRRPTVDELVYELPTPTEYMVMTVAREGPGEPQVILRRRIVPNHEYEAEELAFLFRELTVARRNLNGVGSFGSQVTGGVAARWAS